MSPSIEKILQSRRSTYGSFTDICSTSQQFKTLVRNTIHDRRSVDASLFTPYMLESLDMILHKIARIIHGNPRYADNWVDIIGYAKLVAERLEELERAEYTSFPISDT